MNALIKRIDKSNIQIKFTAFNILKFFKYCAKLELEPKKIELIGIRKIPEEKREPFKKENCLSSEEIDKLASKNKEKEKLKEFFFKLYFSYDKECLMNLIQSSNGKDYCRIILNLLQNKSLKINEFPFKVKEIIPIFQKNLFFVSNNKEEINIIIKISKNLTKCLDFIYNYYNEIYSILDMNATYFSSEKTNYLLSLSPLKPNDDIDPYILIFLI